MYIILDKPSLSFKKNSDQLPGKQITIYTNQLQKVTRSHLVKHLVTNNKLSAFSNQLSNISLSKIDKQKLIYKTYLKTSELKSNLVIDLLLEKDQNLLTYKIQFPLILQFRILQIQSTIYSLTKHLHLDDNFIILNKIGEGTFAQVYLAREKGTNYLRAIKVLNKQRCIRLGQISYITNQITLLRQVQSYWHIQLYYIFQQNNNVYIVTQYCPYGDLYTQINKNVKNISVKIKYAYFIQICFALCRLHQKGFVYRDLKPENVLIDYNGNAKLCDFGYAVKLKPGQLLYDLCGSYEYLPPQMVNKQGYNHSHDLYCLGLLFYQLLTGNNPFKGINPKNLSQMSSRKIKYEIAQFQQETKDLLKKLLQKDPKRRIGYQSSIQLFKHPFFKQNSQLVVKILKNEKINSMQTSNFRVKNLGPRRQVIQQQKPKKINIPTLFGGKIYNYLNVNFNFDQLMGPKIIPSDHKNSRNQNQD